MLQHSLDIYLVYRSALDFLKQYRHRTIWCYYKVTSVLLYCCILATRYCGWHVFRTSTRQAGWSGQKPYTIRVSDILPMPCCFYIFGAWVLGLGLIQAQKHLVSLSIIMGAQLWIFFIDPQCPSQNICSWSKQVQRALGPSHLLLCEQQSCFIKHTGHGKQRSQMLCPLSYNDLISAANMYNI